MLKRLDQFCQVKGNTVLEAVTALHRGRRTAFDNVFSTASESYFLREKGIDVHFGAHYQRADAPIVLSLKGDDSKVAVEFLQQHLKKRFSHTVFSTNSKGGGSNVIVTFDSDADTTTLTGLSEIHRTEIQALLEQRKKDEEIKVPDHLKPLSAKAIEQYKAYHSGSPEVRLATMLSAIATNLGLGSAEVVEAFLIHLLRAPAKDMPPTIKQGSTEVSKLLFGSNQARLVDYGNGKDKFLNSTTLLNILGFMFAYGIMDNRHGAKVAVLRLLFPNLTISPNDAKAEFKQNCIAAHRTEINRICSTDKDGKIDLEAEGKYFFTTAMHEALKFYCRLYQPGK